MNNVVSGLYSIRLYPWPHTLKFEFYFCYDIKWLQNLFLICALISSQAISPFLVIFSMPFPPSSIPLLMMVTMVPVMQYSVVGPKSEGVKNVYHHFLHCLSTLFIIFWDLRFSIFPFPILHLYILIFMIFCVHICFPN